MPKHKGAQSAPCTTGSVLPRALEDSILQPSVARCQRAPGETLDPRSLGPGWEELASSRCIPDAVREEIQSLLEQSDLFLGQEAEMEINHIRMMARMHTLVLAGHIQLPGTLTVWNKFLGECDTSSLPQKGTDEL